MPTVNQQDRAGNVNAMQPVHPMPEWGVARDGRQRADSDASKMARRDYGIKPGDSGAFDFDAGFQRGIVFGRATARQGVVPPQWSKEPPKVQGVYWHWSGDLDASPIPLSVLGPGSSNKCFVTAGQYGITEAIDCDQYGGYWQVAIEPALDESIGYHGDDT